MAEIPVLRETRLILGSLVRNAIRTAIKSKLQRVRDEDLEFICDADLKAVLEEHKETLFGLEEWTQTQMTEIAEHCYRIIGTLIMIDAFHLQSIQKLFYGDRKTLSAAPKITDLQLLDDPEENHKLAEFLALVPHHLQQDFLRMRYALKPHLLVEQASGRLVRLDVNVRLPFLEELPVQVGGYGDVSKVVIAPHYLVTAEGAVNAQPMTFAMKTTLCSKISLENAVAEYRILKESLKAHHTILPHLACFIHGEKLQILLPLAKHGSLEMLLNGGVDEYFQEEQYSILEEFPSFNLHDDRPFADLLNQFVSIVDAVDWSHSKIFAPPAYFPVIHWDLKPSTILISEDRNNRSTVGIWKLSDFGLSVVRENEDRTRLVTVRDVYNLLRFPPSDEEPPFQARRDEGTFQAPEVEKSRTVNQRSDVWPLACIFSEVVTFGLGGESLVGEFRRSRYQLRRSFHNWLDDFFVFETQPTAPRPRYIKISPAVNVWLLMLVSYNPDRARIVQRCVEAVTEGLTVGIDLRPTIHTFKTLVKLASKADPKIPRKRLGVVNSTAPPKTDSGYASAPRTRTAKGEQLEVAHNIRPPQPESSLHWGLLLPITADDRQIEVTDYSASSSLMTPEEAYANWLATTLFDNIALSTSNQATLKRISQKLHGLVGAFALKLGYRANDPTLHETSAFIYKCRRRVQQAFEERLRSYKQLDRVIDPTITESPNSKFAIDRYLQESDKKLISNNALPESLAPGDFGGDGDGDNDNDGFDFDSDSDFARYRDLVSHDPAFDWLLGALRSAAVLNRTHAKVIDELGARIRSQLGSRYLVRCPSPPAYRATFELDWDPLAFVFEQRYAEPAAVVLNSALVLTGTATDAQALTVVEYLTQTWPANGRLVAELISRIAGQPATPGRITLPDGALIEMRLKNFKVVAVVEGTVDSVVEFGQQLAWMGAALRSSPLDNGIATCTPFIKGMFHLESETSAIFAAEIDCTIGFDLSPPDMGDGAGGRCWHAMFRNPVMVSGFPILAKPTPGLGVEIPLGMLPTFVGSRRVTEFDGQTFIKGFSTMLASTALVDDMVIWHFVYNKERQRISYLDRPAPVAEAGFQQVQSGRHVVGWCTSCQYRAGAADAEYGIKGTGLPPPHGGCLLEKVSVSAGQYITVGATFAVGAKDVGPHLSRDGYINTLEWLQTEYTVLWDEAESQKRGWLVNGTSAVLHLVRAKLAAYEAKLGEDYLFDPSRLCGAGHGPKSAFDILRNQQNQELVVFVDRVRSSQRRETNLATGESSEIRTEQITNYSFGDLAEYYASLLDQIIDHQHRAAGERGYKIKACVRKQLEGWDFADLVSGRNPRPRVATLDPWGHGWVDLIRSINAVVLFGRDFGEIMRPSEPKGMCPQWQRLPAGRYYLAASIRDLKSIAAVFGDGRAQPSHLIRGYLWHSPLAYAARCPCQLHTTQPAQSDAGHYDPVQVLCPAHWRHVGRVRVAESPEDSDGAAVFGHNTLFGYYWVNDSKKDLESGTLALPPTEQSGAETSGFASDSTEPLTNSSLSTVAALSTPLESVENSSERGQSSRARWRKRFGKIKWF